MGYTYKTFEHGYDIYKDGKIFLHQYEPYILFPASSYKESAELHIQKILEDENRPKTKSLEEEVVDLKSQVKNLQLALADIYAKGGAK